MEAAANAIHEHRNDPPSIDRDSILIHNYNYLAEAYSGRGDSLALLYIDSLEMLLGSTEWDKAAGLYHRAIGKYHDRRGEFQQALDSYTRAVEEFNAIGDESAYLVYTSILKAFVLNNNGLPDDCERELAIIQPIAEKLENKNYLAWIIDAFGDHYFYSGFGKQDIPRALDYYLEVEAILPGVSNNMIIADNAHCLSGCYLRLGDEPRALEYRDKALAIAKEHNLHSVTFAVYGDLAEVYELQGNYAEAIRYRELSLEYARQTHWIEMEARAEVNIANTYKLAGDFENALMHFEQLKTIEDSLERHRVQMRYSELEALYESKEKDLEIQSLRAANMRMILGILAGLIFLGGIVIIYIQSLNRRLRNQNIALRQKNLEIQAALTEGQNLERKRMAIELHDNINAKIAATKWMVESITFEQKTEEEQAMLNRLVNSIEEIYKDVRFISHNLVPKEIEEKPLEELIGELLTNLNQNQKIHFTFQATGSPGALNNSVKLQAYSILMELINNTLKHSDCKEASVTIDYTSNEIQLKVRDDGKGFDPKADYAGAGLKNVRARVENIHSTIDIDSGSNEGTSIMISIPYA